MSEEANHLESRVATVESEINQLVQSFSTFTKASESWRRDVSAALTGLSDKISDKTAPNLGTWAAWAAVIVAIVLGVATPITVGIIESANRDREDSRRAYATLDLKLQKEYELAGDNQREQVANLRADFEDVQHNGSPATRERLAVLETKQSVADERLKADLEELRRRRMNDAIK